MKRKRSPGLGIALDDYIAEAVAVEMVDQRTVWTRQVADRGEVIGRIPGGALAGPEARQQEFGRLGPIQVSFTSL